MSGSNTVDKIYKMAAEAGEIVIVVLQCTTNLFVISCDNSEFLKEIQSEVGGVFYNGDLVLPFS
jgi:hypothetical protein